MPSGTYSIKWDNHWTLKLLEAIQGNDAWNRSLFGKSIVKTNDIWKATRDICLVLFGKDEAWYTFMHGKGFVGRNDQGDVMPTGQWGSKFKDPVRTKLENLNRAVTSKSLKRKHGFSKRWKQWSDIPDSVQRNKLRAACPYYFILHELHDGKPAYIPPAPVAPPPAVPPSARRPNKRPRQLATPGDSSEDEDAPRVIRGRKSSPIVVNDTSDSESDETESTSAIDKDDGSAVLVPIKPVVRQAQMLVPSASSSRKTIKPSQSAATTHGTSRTAPSPPLSAAANRKVQQEQANMDSAISDGQGPWVCRRIATGVDSDSEEENASDGSETDQNDSMGNDSADRPESDDTSGGANTRVSATPPPSTVPGIRRIQRWLLVARYPPQHKYWLDVGKNSRDSTGAPAVISTNERLRRIRTIRLRNYLKAFIGFRDRGLVLVGPPIEIKVTAAVKNVKEKSLRSLFALLERFGSEQPMRITGSYTKGKHLRLLLDSFVGTTEEDVIIQESGYLKTSVFALLKDFHRLYKGLPCALFDRTKYWIQRPCK